MSEAGTPAETDSHPRRTWFMAALFMVGSLCFAAAAAPGLSAALPSAVVAAVFVVGSLFFTSGAAMQWAAATPPWGLDWWAAAIQLAGTLWFNVNTIVALDAGLTTQQQDLRVWTPDMIGSVCFLASSTITLRAVRAARGAARTSALLNLLGSVFFMAAAIAAFVSPATDDAIAARVANGGTFLGALCFLRGARLLLPSVGTAFRDGDGAQGPDAQVPPGS